MKNPITRLLYVGILGLGVSIAMILENYLSKSNTSWEYIIASALLLFSLIFIIGSIKIGRKKK